MNYILKKNNVERMADTEEAKERLIKLGYEVLNAPVEEVTVEEVTVEVSEESPAEESPAKEAPAEVKKKSGKKADKAE